MPSRHLDWDGCFNARDLGGLPTRGGPATRWRSVIRSDALDGLTAGGWSALHAYGVRTVVDLRDQDERGPDTATRPPDITTIHLPLDVSEDREFWDIWKSGPQFGTPLYYGPHLARFPERSAAVIAAIAAAQPGAVLFHCGGGRDRVGQIAMVLLHLAGVPDQQIADDYMLSATRLPALYAARAEEDQSPILEAFLAARDTSAAEVLVETLATIDIEERLRAGGLSDADIHAARARLHAV